MKKEVSLSEAIDKAGEAWDKARFAARKKKKFRKKKKK